MTKKQMPTGHWGDWDHSIRIERESILCQGIAFTRSFYMSLIAVKGQKPERFQ
jgi:hypothetical protein